LEFAYKKFGEDREIILESVKSNTMTMALAFADESFRDDKEIMVHTIKSIKRNEV